MVDRDRGTGLLCSVIISKYGRISRDERGSIWRRFATNAPFFAKAFLAVLILCLLGSVASTLLPSDFAVTVQIAILAFTLVLSFFYSILLNKFKRKSALGDLGCVFKQVECIRRKFVAQTGLTPDALGFMREEAQRFLSARREARKMFTDCAYAALVVGVFVSFLVRLADSSGDSTCMSFATTLFVIVGFAMIVLMSLAGPLWDLADQKNEMPVESVELFSRDIGFMILIERGCKPQNEKRSHCVAEAVHTGSRNMP